MGRRKLRETLPADAWMSVSWAREGGLSVRRGGEGREQACQSAAVCSKHSWTAETICERRST